MPAEYHGLPVRNQTKVARNIRFIIKPPLDPLVAQALPQREAEIAEDEEKEEGAGHSTCPRKNITMERHRFLPMGRDTEMVMGERREDSRRMKGAVLI
jgi:hypothetical protein